MKKLYFIAVAFFVVFQIHSATFLTEPIGGPQSSLIVIPTFNPIAPICSGSVAPELPTISTNGITGTWSPSVIDNTASASYTFTPTAGQDASTVTIDITVNPSPAEPTFTIIQPSCTESTATIIITGVPGETYSFDGASYSAILIYSGLAAGSSHTITAKNAAECISVIANVTLNAQPQTPLAPTVTIIEPTCANPTGTIVITGVPGETYMFDSGPFSSSLVYSSLSAGSLHTIDAKNAAGCVSVATTVTIGFPQSNAGTDGGTIVCDSSSSTIDLFSLIAGAQTGGVWTRATGAGGVFNAAAGTFTPAAGATTSNFVYTIAGVGTCVDDSSVATVVINAQPSPAILSGDENICVGLTTVFSATLSGGTWSSSNSAVAVVNALTGIVTGMSSGTATITYTLTGMAPCVNETATRTVTVNAPPLQPSMQGFQGICVGSWTVFTADPPGGTWSSSNNAVAMVDNTGFILGGAPGVTTISYTIAGSGGCPDRTAVRDVTVSATPIIVLTSDPITANQLACDSTPITPIVYTISGSYLFDVIATGLPAGVSGSFAAGVFTISGTPTVTGTFSYTVQALGPCGNGSSSGNIMVDPSLSTIVFCDPSGVTTPTSVFFDWGNIVGITSFEFTYSIDNGPLVSSSTNISHYEVFDVLPGQSVTFTLTNVTGVNCFQPVSATCNNLAKESFESAAFESFPNPVNSVLNLTGSKAINNVTIINAFGQSVHSKTYRSKSIQIDMSQLMSGIYMVKLSTDNTSKTIKIIKD
jgi:Secretion system C-terminal sorting domain/Bacterial Ig-like domain (group 2)